MSLHETTMNNDFKVRLKPANELTPVDIQNWRNLQYNDPTLHSPYYCPDFAQAIHMIGQTVFVAIISNAQNDVIGIFPFHRSHNNIGSPVGGPICDFQGMIGPLKNQIETTALLKACGLKAFDFNHLPVTQTSMAKGQFCKGISPYMNLENGYEAWREKRLSAGAKKLKSVEKMECKLERKNSPLQFQLSTPTDDYAWNKLFEWKRQSYKNMGVKSILDVDWVIAALQYMRELDNEHFAGVLSVLYCEDELIAVSFGIRSKTIYHGWFGSYNPDFRHYSPGIILLLKIAQLCAEQGITRYDYGKGDEAYKKSFGSGATELCEGSVEISTTFAGLSRHVRKLTHKSMSSFTSLDRFTDIQRRAFNRLLKAGAMPNAK